MQFSFDGNPKNLYLPHNLSNDLVLYTGTHDNDTSLGWYENADEGTRSFFRLYLNVEGTTPGWDMIRHGLPKCFPIGYHFGSGSLIF